MHIKINRKEYMAKCNEAGAFDEYYRQFDHPRVRIALHNRFGLDVLRKAFEKDTYFNTTETKLELWEKLTPLLPQEVCWALGQSNGSVYNPPEKMSTVSLSDRICVLKTVAKLMVLEAIAAEAEAS